MQSYTEFPTLQKISEPERSDMKRILLAVLLAAMTQALPAQRLVKGEIKDVQPQGSYQPTFASDGAQERPLNIILMIGDGTGLAQIAAGYYANGGELTVMNLRHIGFVTTPSSSDFITDSAASGTAYATGHKTKNHAVGVDAENRPLQNIPEALAGAGILSGVVTTDLMDGATPASFFAHQRKRSMSQAIWADLPGSPLTFFAAGNQDRFARQRRGTRDSILAVFTLVDHLDDPAAEKAERLGYLPSARESGFIKDGRTDFLPVSTRFATTFLKERADQGFFLMVEGARIDKACHRNQFDSAVLEMLDFDRAIAEALRFADADGHTLVIISADHETGGLSLRSGDPSRGDMKGIFVTHGHTAIPVPLFAYGPHAQDFMGVQGNDEVGRKILHLLLGD